MDAELLSLTSTGSRRVRLEEALRLLGIIAQDETLIEFEKLAPWHRSGSESFVAVASVQVGLRSGAQEERCFVAKAIVSFPSPIPARIEQLCGRYATLRSYGVLTPTIFATHRGVIYQSHIPHELTREALLENPTLLFDLCHIAAVLDHLGARPLDFARDLRTDGDHVYYVDVGEDLGSLEGESGSRAREQLLGFVARHQLVHAASLYRQNRYVLAEGRDHMSEKTLIVLKPDVLERRLVGKVITYLENAGFRIVKVDMRTVTPEFVERHYPDSMAAALGRKSADAGDQVEDYEAQGKRVLGWLRGYISRGPVFAVVLEGKEVIRQARQVVGHTDPSMAEKGTIRGDFGVDSILKANQENRACENLVHASGTAEEAQQEIALWFGEAHA